LHGRNALHTFAAMTAAEEVNAIIDRKGWSQYELAKRANVPRSTIKRIREGADAKSSTMEKIRTAAKHTAKK